MARNLRSQLGKNIPKSTKAPRSTLWGKVYKIIVPVVAFVALIISLANSCNQCASNREIVKPKIGSEELVEKKVEEKIEVPQKPVKKKRKIKRRVKKSTKSKKKVAPKKPVIVKPRKKLKTNIQLIPAPE